MASKVDVAFNIDNDVWHSLSPKLITARRLILSLFAGATLIAAAVAFVLKAPILVVGLIVLARHGKDVPIPFGPYLASAGLIALFWGKDLTQLYFLLI